jgi:hypothetical protein
VSVSVCAGGQPGELCALIMGGARISLLHVQIGEHLSRCGEVFLNIDSTAVVLYPDFTQCCELPSIYLDSHGEEDRHLRRYVHLLIISYEKTHPRTAQRSAIDAE